MRKKQREILFAVMSMLCILAVKLITIPYLEGEKGVSAQDIRTQAGERIAIQKVLTRYNSPLAPYTNAFIESCRKYNLNCYLLPAISGVESGFGHALIQAAKNPFGWGGGSMYFDTWESGINTVAKGLHENYVEKGLTNPYLIAPVYAPPSHTWAGNVSMYMSMFEQEEIVIAKRFAQLKQAGVM